MNCGECLEQLEAYVDGELGAKEEMAIAGHLKECYFCQAQYADLISLRQDIAGAIEDIPVPLGLERRILANVLSRGLVQKDNLLPGGQASVWNLGMVLAFLFAPVLFLLHPFTMRLLSLGYGMSRVLGRGLYVLSAAVPLGWTLGLGLAGLVILVLAVYVIWRLVQEMPLREAASS